VESPPDTARTGADCRVLLFLTIRDGWHINAPVPSDSDLVGTSLQIERMAGVDSVIIQFPDAVERHLDFSEVPLEVYEGTVVVPIRFRLATGMQQGTYALAATLTYQACNSSVCLAPSTVEMTIPLLVRSHHGTILRKHRNTAPPTEKGRHP